MKIDLVGRVNNINLNPKHCLWPLFEAISNSIHAIEEMSNLSEGKIKVRLIRDKQNDQSILPDPPQEILASINCFEIEDNGIGFNDDNFNSFNISDSTKKKAKGGKGIGRFIWLKTFDRAEIFSVFEETGGYHERKFNFSLEDEEGVSGGNKNESTQSNNKTTVKLIGFRGKFKETCHKKAETIGEKIITHFLSYFLLNNCPQITIYDGDRTIDLKNQYETKIRKDIKEASFKINGYDFTISHIKLYSIGDPDHKVYYCAWGREVDDDNLKRKIPDLSIKLHDKEDREFYYKGYVCGNFLDERVNQERTELLFQKDEEQKNIFKEISETKLKETVYKEVERFLSDYLEPIKRDKIQKIEDYIVKKNPKYRPLLRNKNEYFKLIPPGLTDDQNEIELHKVYSIAFEKLKQESQDFLKTTLADVKNIQEYKDNYNKIVSNISEFAMSALAEYIIHRKLIIDLFNRNLKQKEDGRFSLEETIHNLIFPIRSTSDDINMEENQNLWVIDEKLTYHQYLSSDIPFNRNPHLESESEKRADIMVFNYNEPMAFVESELDFSSVTIIEFKRPCRTEYPETDDPVLQIYKYIEEIRKGKKRNKNGRYIPGNPDMPYYCYIVCDLTPQMKTIAINYDYTETPDKKGYFGYHKGHKAYIEIISYDKLLSDAIKRNRVLFDKLGIPDKI